MSFSARQSGARIWNPSSRISERRVIVAIRNPRVALGIKSTVHNPHMSYLSDLNEDPNNHRYIDADNLLDYVFVGFDEPLTVERKRELIARFGRSRRASLQTKIEGEGYTIDFGPLPFETQVIDGGCSRIVHH